MMNGLKRIFCVGVVFFGAELFAQLPANYQLNQDWLIDNSAFKAKIITDKKNNKITISNGLVSRTFLLKPSLTTIRFDNLMTGETLIRALNPEGEITINKRKYVIGGLNGQRDRAFLQDEWIDQLTPPQNGLELFNIEQGVPKERFAWKRVRHHSPYAVWPPKGVYLRFDFRLPSPSAKDLAAATLSSSRGRVALIKDDFLRMDPAWKIHRYEKAERSAFVNEGKPGEIYTPANSAVYAERPLPKLTRLVEVTIHPGTDLSASWGPGIALVWPKKVLKFYIRPEGGNPKKCRFALWDGHREISFRKAPRPNLSVANTLRIRMDSGKMFFEVKQPNKKWQMVGMVPFSPKAQPPVAVRIGKMDARGGKTNHRSVGDFVRLRIRHFAAYGALDQKALPPVAKNTNSKKPIVISLHYELYDGVPLMSKWITVHNDGKRSINVDRFIAEELSLIEYDNPVMGGEWPLRRSNMIHAETDMAFRGFTYRNANTHTIHWMMERNFRSQVNWGRKMPCRLEIKPTYGPDQTVEPGKTFESFRAFLLVYDSQERERRGLALKQLYRTVAPWVTENPIMMHLRTAKEKIVRRGIDQCAEVGFEMLILSFGSGFNSENRSPAYLAKWKKIADYAHSKGIHIGSYSLLSSRGIKPASDMIKSPKGQRPTHNRCPALASEWGQNYFKTLRNLFEKTGFDLLENDGSYPGDVDVTPRPPLQKGINDSRWVQWRIISGFYQWLRGRGVYLNVPDFYYLAGANKCGMGYRESNWSQPRELQRIHTRQNIYDATWEKTPSMGWMFVPLTAYQGGGEAATIEPLEEHLDHYEMMMRSNLGLGVQACYRGPRLYDTPKTRDMLKRVVGWYKKHRDILESDMIHGRRADGRDIDWMLHVNAKLKEKGYISLYNPTDHAITKTIRVSLYYTGIQGAANFTNEAGKSFILPLDANHFVNLKVSIPAQGYLGYSITPVTKK